MTEFSFTATNGPGSATDWRGHGRGTVAVEQVDQALLFRESALFTSSDGHKVELQNRYRWSRLPQSLQLAHLRRGEPVLLFELEPVTEHGFRSVQPHLCGADTYSAELLLHKTQLEMIWHIRGPRKNEQLHYHYW